MLPPPRRFACMRISEVVKNEGAAAEVRRLNQGSKKTAKYLWTLLYLGLTA